MRYSVPSTMVPTAACSSRCSFFFPATLGLAPQPGLLGSLQASSRPPFPPYLSQPGLSPFLLTTFPHSPLLPESRITPTHPTLDSDFTPKCSTQM